jgi:hypothetical protein
MPALARLALLLAGRWQPGLCEQLAVIVRLPQPPRVSDPVVQEAPQGDDGDLVVSHHLRHLAAEEARAEVVELLHVVQDR